MMSQTLSHYDAYTWGGDHKGSLGLGDAVGNYVSNPTKITVNVGNITWTQVASGKWHSIALSSNGEVFTWGDDFYGSLGHGGLGGRNVPTKVQYLSEERIVKVACGDKHSAALTSTGKLFTW